MGRIVIHVMHTGTVCVSPYLSYGGENCSTLKAAGIGTRKKDRLWIPVSCYLIEHPKGFILFDCGWERAMSPEGVFDKKAQIRSLGGYPLYFSNQGVVPLGCTVGEQLVDQGIWPRDLDYVLLSHLDCDHVNGLSEVRGARRILVSVDELACATGKGFVKSVRFNDAWWAGSGMETFDWNGNEGPAGKSFDLFGDGTAVMINIPGHTDGLCALRLRGDDGHFVLLCSDGGYSTKSWDEMILPGISLDKEAQRSSLAWIREQAHDERCVECLANHDPDVEPHTVII